MEFSIRRVETYVCIQLQFKPSTAKFFKCMLLRGMPWISLVPVNSLNPMIQYFWVGYSILLLRGRMHLLQFARMNERTKVWYHSMYLSIASECVRWIQQARRSKLKHVSFAWICAEGDRSKWQGSSASSSLVITKVKMSLFVCSSKEGRLPFNHAWYHVLF